MGVKGSGSQCQVRMPRALSSSCTTVSSSHTNRISCNTSPCNDTTRLPVRLANASYSNTTRLPLGRNTSRSIP